jgi:cytochrome c biogenesis protein CcmG/thiol:disulfide interchange protein DsbE
LSDVSEREQSGGRVAPEPARRSHRVRWVALAAAVPVAAFLVILATRPQAGTRAADSPLLGKPAPPIAGKTIDGQDADIVQARGKWVLVNFFATWCVPCRDEHPDLVRFAQEHAATGDATVLGVVYDDDAGAVKSFRDKEGGDWPMVTDPRGQIALDFGVSGVPESYIVSPDGRVAAKVVGGIQLGALDSLLAKVQAGASPRG